MTETQTPAERLSMPDMFKCPRLPGPLTLSRTQCGERYQKSHDPLSLYPAARPAIARGETPTFDSFRFPSMLQCWGCPIGAENAGLAPMRQSKDLGAREKECNRCGAVKPLKFFHKDPYGKFGRKAVCKECRQKEAAGEPVPPRPEPRKAMCKACWNTPAESRGFCGDCYRDWYKGRKEIVKKFGSWYPKDHPEKQKIPPGGLPEKMVAGKLAEGRKVGLEIHKQKTEVRPVEEIKQETQVCPRCGKEKELDDFQRNTFAPSGRQRICRACLSKATKDGQRKSKKIHPDETTLVLDTKDWPEVMEALPDAARTRIRTIEHQAIKYIVQGLKLDGYGGKEVEA